MDSYTQLLDQAFDNPSLVSDDVFYSDEELQGGVVSSHDTVVIARRLNDKKFLVFKIKANRESKQKLMRDALNPAKPHHTNPNKRDVENCQWWSKILELDTDRNVEFLRVLSNLSWNSFINRGIARTKQALTRAWTSELQKSKAEIN